MYTKIPCISFRSKNVLKYSYTTKAYNNSISRFTKQYFALRYGAREAKPINMTLAMWRTFSNR